MLIGYYAALDELHDRLRPSTYLEIGVHTGDSLALVRPGTRALAVDPALPDCLAGPVAAELHPVTSDEFFATVAPVQLDLCFIDGLHLFEQALRDFMNAERWSSPSSTIVIHDCLPIDEVTASRDRSTVVWSGDVWKVVWCLREARPDLDVRVLDVEPTGLAVVCNLDPSSTVLADRYDDLVARHLSLGWPDLVAAGGPSSLVSP